MEVDPRTGSIEWEWSATEPGDFYCRTRGTCQGLPNGNVLVADSERGVAFEVTREGEIVWRFVSPEVNEEGRRGAIRIRRYEPEYVGRILESRK